MEQKKLRWKDIYNENKVRKYSEITGIKKENVEIESNSIKALKNKKYLVIAIAILFSALIIWTFRRDIRVIGIVFIFFILAGIAFFIFNYFRLVCLKEGLYIRFGIQEGLFPYDKIKSVFLSKYNDYTFLIPNSKTYSVVVRYKDSFNRIREFSFPNYFLGKQETEEFLNNFNIKETPDQQFVQYERFKVLKRIGKAILLILVILAIIGLLVMNMNK